MVFSDKLYKESDYIRSFNTYKNIKMIKLNKSIIKDVYVISSLKHKDKEVFFRNI